MNWSHRTWVAQGVAVCFMAVVALNLLGQTNQPPVRQINADVFEIGTVRLDKSLRTVQFPAKLISNEGLMEYLIVQAKGKTYESLLKTEADPYYIQLAMLLLGAKGAPQPASLPSAPFHVNRPAGDTHPPPPAIHGDAITIELSWQDAGQSKRARAEDWLTDLTTHTNASRGNWTFNGSRIVHDTFIAQRDGQIVALVDDIDAMANNPRPGHDNDQIWQVRSNALPPLNTDVEVTFHLEP